MPTLTLGVDTTNDPANAMFTNTNFPGAANADLTNARALYALLTGRVTQIGSNARLDGATGTVRLSGRRADATSSRTSSACSCRTPGACGRTLTINAGLRWQIAFPFQADDSVYLDEHVRGPLRRSRGSATAPAAASATSSTPACSTPAAARRSTSCTRPAIPATTPTTTTSRRTSASPGSRTCRTAGCGRCSATRRRRPIRASYGVSYNSDGLSFYTGVYNSNPGNQITTNRTTTSTQFPLVPAGETWPVLLRDPERLGPSPDIPAGPVYPMAIDFNSGVNLFHPNFRTPFSRSFSVGLQRTLSPADGGRGPLRRHAAGGRRRRRRTGTK